MLDENDFEKFISDKRKKRFEEIDKLPPELKNCVHEWGYNIVKNFVDLGIKKEKHINHLVRLVINETRAPEGFCYSAQGARKK